MITKPRDVIRMTRRPPKQSSDEICKNMGFESVVDFLARVKTQPYWDSEDPEPEGFIDIEEFPIRAFPEFPPPTPSIFSSNRAGLTNESMPGYIAAYEATYRHHYEMQDDWLSIVADPESKNFLGFVPGGRTMDFTTFELVMLAVANDGDWTRSRPSLADYNIDGGITVNFIIDWRIKLGTYRPEVDRRWRAAVWRDNWQDVRNALVEINAREYPSSRKGGSHKFFKDLTVDESVLKATMALCKRLRIERGIEGCVLEDSAVAYTIETHVATQLERFAKGVWKVDIVERSGKPYQLQFMTQ